MSVASAPPKAVAPSRISGGRALLIVTRREFGARVRSKAFIGGLTLMVVLIVAVIGLGSLFGDDELRLGTVGPQPAGAISNVEALAEVQGIELEVQSRLTSDEAEAMLDAGDLDAYVVDGAQLVTDRAGDRLLGLVTPAWGQAQLVDSFVALGVDPADVDAVLAGATGLDIVERDADPDADSRQGIALITVILTFVAIQFAGGFIMIAVFEEKSSKVVELVLASVPARALLAGKILGVGGVVVIQVLVLATAAIAAARLSGSGALPVLSASMVVLSIAWVLVGYLMYGAIFAAGASLAPRQEDAQNTLLPVTVVLMLGYFGSLFAASDPGSTLARVVSWVPLTSPFAMPGRFADGNVAWWEVAGSMTLALAAAAVVLVLAERIYVRSVIHTDRTLGWREAWSLDD